MSPPFIVFEAVVGSDPFFCFRCGDKFGAQLLPWTSSKNDVVSMHQNLSLKPMCIKCSGDSLQNCATAPVQSMKANVVIMEY